MAAIRTTMRKIREILRLRYSAQLSIRQISRSTKASVGKIQELLSQAESLQIQWPLPAHLDDQQLLRMLYPEKDFQKSEGLVEPDWKALHHELKGKGVTRQLLWEEYTQQNPLNCYGYSQFCERYRQWRGHQKRSMRQMHKAGEKCFVDYCGMTIPIINSEDGSTQKAEIFVGILGASNYTFAEATLSQSLPDWLSSHVLMFEFFGGCPEIVVPDNLRSRDHQEQAYRVCLGVLHLSKSYPQDRINIACQIANQNGLKRLKSIKSILDTHWDQLDNKTETPSELPQQHDNVRGAGQFT